DETQRSCHGVKVSQTGATRRRRSGKRSRSRSTGLAPRADGPSKSAPPRRLGVILVRLLERHLLAANDPERDADDDAEAAADEERDAARDARAVRYSVVGQQRRDGGKLLGHALGPAK